MSITQIITIIVGFIAMLCYLCATYPLTHRYWEEERYATAIALSILSVGYIYLFTTVMSEVVMSC